MKLSKEHHKDTLIHLTLFPSPSGTYISSKTPGRDMKERWSLGRIPYVGFWLKFYKSFIRMHPFTWPQLQVNQEPSCFPRLKVEPWRIGGVLTGFLMFDLDENFTKGCYQSSDLNTRSLRILYVLQDSRKRPFGKVESWQAPIYLIPTPGLSRSSLSSKTPEKKLRGEVESWQCFWCWILMKISQKLHKDAPFYLSPMPGGSGSSMSSKTPGRDLEECLIRMLLFTWLQSGTFMSSRKWHVEKDIDSTIYKLCEAKPRS